MSGYYPGPNPPDAAELRVLGSLIEKRRTTPDAYPLSVNSLRLACNQVTNRDPVVDFDEHTILDALEHLGRRGWTRLASGAGSRARKYRHMFDEALGLADPEVALLCVLMLRGPQTPGELKQRTDRLHSFADLTAIEETLDRLIDRELAARLPRRPGQKEQRYVQLLDGGEPDEDGSTQRAPAALATESSTLPPESSPSTVDPPDEGDRTGRLEREVAELRERVARLEDLLGA
ncbi:MAG TPA: YceH family protein [Thermoleophilaceae bacterium]|nr:YceH family protein [Thermoleophilaceae bacterium]